MSSDKTLSSGKNNTKIIWFGSVVLILQQFLETQSFTNFVKSVWAITAGIVVHKFSLCFVCMDQWAFGQQCMEVKRHYPWLKCHENEEKYDNDYVLRNDHRIKTTQPISMILVSVFFQKTMF